LYGPTDGGRSGPKEIKGSSRSWSLQKNEWYEEQGKCC
jgi:hypothetical protein